MPFYTLKHPYFLARKLHAFFSLPMHRRRDSKLVNLIDLLDYVILWLVRLMDCEWKSKGSVKVSHKVP